VPLPFRLRTFPEGVTKGCHGPNARPIPSRGSVSSPDDRSRRRPRRRRRPILPTNRNRSRSSCTTSCRRTSSSRATSSRTKASCSISHTRGWPFCKELGFEVPSTPRTRRRWPRPHHRHERGHSDAGTAARSGAPHPDSPVMQSRPVRSPRRDFPQRLDPSQPLANAVSCTGTRPCTWPTRERSA
jgi:hypothetical protein